MNSQKKKQREMVSWEILFFTYLVKLDDKNKSGVGKKVLSIKQVREEYTKPGVVT